MIIKISQRKAESSFSRLADYICKPKEGKDERIQEIRTGGFEIEQPDWEIARNHIAEQHREKTKNSKSAADNTLHVIISFRPEERKALDSEAIAEIVQKTCDSLHLGNHKRISATHGDTQDPHLHVAINLLDSGGCRKTPYKAFLAVREVREAIEKQHGFNPPGDRAKGTPARPSDPNQKRESHSNQASFESWLKNNIAAGLSSEIGKKGADWKSVQDYLAKNGSTLRKQGAGLVFSSTSEKVFCKASTIDRSFSLANLQKVLGTWQDVATTSVGGEGFKSHFVQSKQLYADYQIETKEKKKGRSAARDEAKQIFKEQREKISEEIRTEKDKVMKNMNDPRKRVGRLKALTFERAQMMEAAREDNQKRASSINEKFKHKTWVQFLQDKSESGDLGALRALQSRKEKETPHPGNQIYTPQEWEPVGNTLRGLKAQIRANGDLAFRLPSGQENEIIDKGRRLMIGDKFSNDVLDASLKLAVAKFGNTLHLQGSDEFKKAIIQRAEEQKLQVSFANRPETTNRRDNGR